MTYLMIRLKTISVPQEHISKRSAPRRYLPRAATGLSVFSAVGLNVFRVAELLGIYSAQ